MRDTRTQRGIVPQGTPEYLREYHARLRAAGINAKLPTARGGVEVPELMNLPGRPLSEIIREMREDG